MASANAALTASATSSATRSPSAMINAASATGSVAAILWYVARTRFGNSAPPLETNSSATMPRSITSIGKSIEEKATQSVVPSREPITAAPTVAPIWRKKSDALVTWPMKRTSAAFWTARVKSGIAGPTPSPHITVKIATRL